MSRKDKFLAKKIRHRKEVERQRQALEKRSSNLRVEELGITDVERGTLEFSEDPNVAKTVNYVNEKGVSQIQSIDKIEVIQQDSKEWEAYLASGGDPNLTEGHVAIRLTTKDENEPNGNKSNSHTPPRNNQVHSSQNNEMLPLILESIHPDSRKVMPSTEAITVLKGEGWGNSKLSDHMNEKLLDQLIDRVKHAASIDPNEEILVKHMMDRPISADENLSLFYSNLSEADISPGVDNKELNLVYNLLTDTATRRIRFDQLNYPVWEGHTTHPTRNEGFITKPPFPKMYIQFDGFIDLPPMESDIFVVGSELYTPDYINLSSPQYQGMITKKISISIGAIAFSNDIQHVLIQKNSSGTTRTILPQEGKTWKITPPQETDPNYDGYSTGKNDSIMLGYLHWFGLLLDSNHQGLAKINQGTYFDINTGAIWLPLIKITGGRSEKMIHATNVFQIEKNRMSTHLIPAGSGIKSSILSAGWDSNRKLNIFEDTAMRVGDIFMFIMNYMTSPRMQTEEVQGSRGERRRAQKRGLPPPPPWTTISYKPPSNIKRNSVATGTGSKHRYMYDVRGHWKNQPHGPRREQRKLIWIHPHYSGLANETYIPRNRLVQEKEEYED